MEAVIFDMDGVIIDSDVIYLQYFYEPFVRNDQPVDFDDMYQIVGNDINQTFKILGGLWTPYKTADEMKELYDIPFDEVITDFADIKTPHIRLIMSELKKRGLSIGIASSSPKRLIDKMINECRLGDYVDFHIGGEQVKNTKPDPEIYLKTMNALGVSAEKTIIIEDSSPGIRAAIDTGALVIALKDNRFGIDQSKADYISSDLVQTLNIILKYLK